jgi:transcription elongation factor SPT6
MGEPAGEPMGEPAGEPMGEPAGEPMGEPPMGAPSQNYVAAPGDAEQNPFAEDPDYASQTSFLPRHQGFSQSFSSAPAPAAQKGSFNDIDRVRANRDESDVYKRFVQDSDLEMLEAATAEEDLDIVKDYIQLHYGDDVTELQAYEDQLLSWVKTITGSDPPNFHRAWHNGEVFLSLIQQAYAEERRAAGAGLNEELAEADPISRFQKAVSVARHKLDLELDLKPVELLKCKNRHCVLIPNGVQDMELENGSFVRLCTVCRPDEAVLINAVDEIRDKYDSFRPDHKSASSEVTSIKQKRAIRKDRYSLCRRAGLLRMTDQFGLTVEEFAENLSMGFDQNTPRQADVSPLEAAEQHVTRVFNTAEKVLDMAKYCMAMQLARDPPVYQTIRNIYNREVAALTVRPTVTGERTIEDWHPYARFRYLTDKPLTNLTNDDFVWITKAHKEKLLTMEITTTDKSLFWQVLEKAVGISRADESDDMGALWNDARKEIVRMALAQMLPRLERDLRTQLTEEAEEYVLEQCSNNLRSMINRAPFQSDEATNEDDVEHGTKVCAITVGNLQTNVPTEIAMLHPAGDVADYLRLDFLTVRETARNVIELQKRQRDWSELKRFLTDHLPQLIVVGAENMDCQGFFRNLEELAQFSDYPDISPMVVEYGDLQIPQIFSISKRSAAEFPEYSARLRQAVSLGRMFQNSELEIAACMNPELEILALKWHPLQDAVPRDQLLNALTQELITTINRTGVDINQALTHKHVEVALPFVCSFGNRKAASLVDSIQKAGGSGRIFSRKHFCGYNDAIGAAVAWVSCGFFFMDSSESIDDDDEMGNMLDTTRIHPEMYIYAGTIARDALEHLPTEADEKSGKTEKIAVFLEDIQEVMSSASEKPEQLDALLLDEYAAEIEKKTGKQLAITLKDIKNEMAHPFKDTRLEFRKMTPLDLFTALTQETVNLMLCAAPPMRNEVPTPDLFEHIGTVTNHAEQFFRDHVEPAPSLMVNQIVDCTVTRLSYKPNEEFPDEPPKSTGINCRVQDSPLRGFVPLRDLTTDRDITDAAERVEEDMEIQCRIRDIQIDRFSLGLGCKSTIMASGHDAGRDWDFSPGSWNWDPDYDGVASREAAANKEAKAAARQSKYQRRAIDHPAFKEVSYGQSEKYLADKPQGEAIVRPSSKGVENLTVSFKITKAAVVHVDVREEGKNENNMRNIGQVLFIRDEQFESLDEILETYVASITAFGRQMTRHKNYRAAKDQTGIAKEDIVSYLSAEKKKAPKRIPYCLWYRKKEPQSFMLSCFTSKAYHEFISIKPDGFKFCDERFTSVVDLLSWFKKNYHNHTRSRSLRSTGNAREGGHQQQVPEAPGGYPPGGFNQPPQGQPPQGQPPQGPPPQHRGYHGGYQQQPPPGRQQQQQQQYPNYPPPGPNGGGGYSGYGGGR